MYRSQNRPCALDWDAPISSPDPAPSPDVRRVRHRPRPKPVDSPDLPADSQRDQTLPVAPETAPGLPAGRESPSTNRQLGSPGYRVGYKRPPTSGQFKKGRSGNPTGRPKGATTTRELFDQELSATVPIREGGRSRKISKREVIVKQQVNKAMQGDAKSTELTMKVEGVIHRGGHGPASSGDPGPVDPRHEEIDREIVDKFLAMAREAPQAGGKSGIDADDGDDNDD